MITEQGIAVPEDMVAALAKAPPALNVFATLSSTRQREYVDWVGKASDGDVRAERLAELAEHVIGEA